MQVYNGSKQPNINPLQPYYCELHAYKGSKQHNNEILQPTFDALQVTMPETT